MLLKHFVTFCSPGTFLSEESTKQIYEWDIERAKEEARDISERYNSKPYGFYFTTRERCEEDFNSKEIKRSNMYWLGGIIRTAEEIIADNLPGEEILRSNIINNDISKIIVNTNSWKVTMPFRDGDILLKWP